MSELRVETWTMPAATLGRENPLPMLAPRPSQMAGRETDESVPPEDRRYFGYGIDAGWLPHRGQDDYDRVRTNRDFVALVLENEFLRATILPEIGGRLWSLWHKPSGRELLHVNRVFQPANLAVRGAWVAGGVEWNACVYGHSPYACSPLFAAVVDDTDMDTVLRLYEWDRSRGVPFQLDLSLPQGSEFLFVRVRITNPHARTIPMYWWSNIAVRESPDIRVLAPADRAYTYEYGGQVHAASVPRHRGVDFTYGTNIPSAADFYFRIPDGARPWIAAVDGEGTGLIQASTSRLVGRKAFAWGMNPGGRRWQEHLSPGGPPYLEIQAGLARTQLECMPMPAEAQWEWMEAYGSIEASAAKVHGTNWDSAVREVGARLEAKLPGELLERRLAQSAVLADKPPRQVLHRGSGWGALERRRRERSGEVPFCTAALVFDDASLGEDQTPWLALLDGGALPEREPSAEPGAWMVQAEWRELLAAAVRDRQGDHWLSRLHLGLMEYAAGDLAEAEAAWRQSLRLTPSGWAHRNLAVLCSSSSRTAEALSHFQFAHELLPAVQPLTIEYCERLLSAGRAKEALALVELLPAKIRRHSRFQLLEARAALSLDQFEHVAKILRDGFELVDIREGENALTDLWFAYHARLRAHAAGRPRDVLIDASQQDDLPPPPSHLDFRASHALCS